ncbi:uncharacterized protein LOC119672746 [Teleopsis dalmanni]|uniref:uncharacterized protein LOC119672746 n=1 Tax=Teleopsis dalmanni TaxID=139649 RepID=UPI0018CF2D0F|nr:uncharacterized protein LOC119672746 [Teleopsis dalmanni]
MIPEVAEIGSSELLMYDTVLPLMEEILEASGDKVKLRPNCLLSKRDSKEIYILEDMNALDYYVADRWLGLDEQHAMCLMGKIAKYHAASMVLIQKFPTEVKKLPASHFAAGAADQIAHSIAIGGLEYVADFLKTWSGFVEISRKILANKTQFNEKIKSIVNPKNSKVNVIMHGDLWVNNFLFRYDNDKKPNDVVLVDFQNCYIGSLGIDLNYFLYTSLQLNVLKTKHLDLLKHYYSVLEDTLRMCEYHVIPSWESVLEEIRSTAFMGLYAAVCELPICCMDKKTPDGFTTATFSNPEEMAKKRKLMYNNERVVETLKYTLHYFNNSGVLD